MTQKTSSNESCQSVNPYSRFVAAFDRLIAEGRGYPLGNFRPPPQPGGRDDAPRVLLCSPHPDDECIIGGLPLRLLREQRMKIVNAVITQGSRRDRQAERLEEVRASCGYLGFDLARTGPNGLAKIRLETRDQDRAHWRAAVDVMARIIAQYAPRVIFLPHANDWNATHVGTHFLVMDALRTMPGDFHCRLVETEYWGPMNAPNLMVESSPADVADLVTALSFHAGEVRRNPYHLRLPAWMIDNVRRGGELLSGQGGKGPDYMFATLYRMRVWSRRAAEDIETAGRYCSCDQPLDNLFG